MSDAGDPDSRLGADTAERLWLHASAIVDAAGVPLRERESVTQELFGHLVERVHASMAEATSEADAAARAIASFGGIDELATDLSSAFHSRLWASTIGVLLPAVVAREDRPGVIGWLRFALGIGVALILLGLPVLIWRAPPVHLVLAVTVLLLGLGGLLLAFRGLALGQRWALWYAIAFAVELVVFGIGSVVAPEVPGSITIPLGGILGAGVLLGVMASWERLQAFVATSAPVSRGLLALLLASFLGPILVGPAMAVIPDPTQATADDVRLTVSVTCDRGDVEEPGFSTRTDVQRVTIVADLAWRRGDFLPNGLDGFVNGAHYGSTAGFRLQDEAMDGALPDWLLVAAEPQVVDVASGETAGWFGSTSQSVALIPDTIGSFTVGIDPAFIRGGHTIRTTWLVVPTADAGAPWPTVQVAYAHLDRFLIIARDAGCGDTVVGRQEPLPPPQSAQSGSDPFDGMLP
jgi:hypothetical protein